MASIYSRATAVVTLLGFTTCGIADVFERTPLDSMQDLHYRGDSKEIAAWFTENASTSPRTRSRNLADTSAAEKGALESITAINQLPK